MEKVIVDGLIVVLRNDQDFKNLCKGVVGVKRKKLIKWFIGSVDLKNYLLDQTYLDISYQKLGKYIFNMDDLYLDFEAYLEDYEAQR